MTSLERFLFFFHILRNACMHISRQFCVRKQDQAILIESMHDVGISCVHLGHVALPTALYLQRILVLSIEARVCCDSAADFIGKKVVSVVVIFKIDIARDFSVIQQKIMSISLGVSLTFRVLSRGKLPPPRYGYRRLPPSPCGTKLSLWRNHCRSNSSVLPLHAGFPEKSLSSPIMLC